MTAARSTLSSSPAGCQRIPVAVLGATGMVGQAFVRLLASHPWFRLAEVAASERSAGRPYGHAVRWHGATMPEALRDLEVRHCHPDAVESPVVFSALDAGVAADVEVCFARAGRTVFSNARSHRLDDDVPLLVPEVNPGHVALLDTQRARRGWPGAIITNANCSTIILALALAPLHERFGIRRLFVSTMQAVSGAGYPGVPSLDILGNVIPHIDGEEEKIEAELRKILGTVGDGEVVPSPIAVSAHCARVPVEHGHTACISVGFQQPVAASAVAETLRSWCGAPEAARLPSAVAPVLVVHDAPDRPQPRLDAESGAGMSVSVGRVRQDSVLDVRLVACGHNIVRGAAGASLLNAELLASQGGLPLP